jgi:hypothetical protein
MYRNYTVDVNPLQPLKNAAQTAFVVMLVGTGSAYAIARFDAWRPHLQHRVSFIPEVGMQRNGVERVDVRTPLEHLENIRTVLNPAVSDLAFVFDVSRQAIYKWLSSESKPEPEKLARVQALSQIADAFKEAGVVRAGSLLKVKTFGDRSLMDTVKAGEEWHEAVDLLIAESYAMERAYDRSGLAKSRARSTSDWQTAQSIPASREDV